MCDGKSCVVDRGFLFHMGVDVYSNHWECTDLADRRSPDIKLRIRIERRSLCNLIAVQSGNVNLKVM